ncbi:hypothetical protein BGZ65_002633 [Modicella reniformis]|uniref:Uncharacterized protein n=1 Tax=Modicella reniformis TaxID=1440133 RepID=A0A9P6LZX4_9FUNG|nr:hypothetical protein BGZ65_002633 [Modicella reniformis]
MGSKQTKHPSGVPNLTDSMINRFQQVFNVMVDRQGFDKQEHSSVALVGQHAPKNTVSGNGLLFILEMNPVHVECSAMDLGIVLAEFVGDPEDQEEDRFVLPVRHRDELAGFLGNQNLESRNQNNH